VGWSKAKKWFKTPQNRDTEASAKAAFDAAKVVPGKLNLGKKLVMEALKMFRFKDGRTKYEAAIKLSSYYSGAQPNEVTKLDILYGSAGSNTFISDIDTNLRGPLNEIVVKEFNDMVRADYQLESGILYDENAYGVDFLDLDYREAGEKLVFATYPVLPTKDEYGKIIGYDEKTLFASAIPQENMDSIIWAFNKIRSSLSLPTDYEQYYKTKYNPVMWLKNTFSKQAIAPQALKTRAKAIYDYFSTTVLPTSEKCFMKQQKALIISYVSLSKTKDPKLTYDDAAKMTAFLEPLDRNALLNAMNKLYEKLQFVKMMFGDVIRDKDLKVTDKYVDKQKKKRII